MYGIIYSESIFLFDDRFVFGVRCIDCPSVYSVMYAVAQLGEQLCVFVFLTLVVFLR